MIYLANTARGYKKRPLVCQPTSALLAAMMLESAYTAARLKVRFRSKLLCSNKSALIALESFYLLFICMALKEESALPHIEVWRARFSKSLPTEVSIAFVLIGTCWSPRRTGWIHRAPCFASQAVVVSSPA